MPGEVIDVLCVLVLGKKCVYLKSNTVAHMQKSNFLGIAHIRYRREGRE